MFNIKLEHTHHLPCHPTRSYEEDRQLTIQETDRQNVSQPEEPVAQFKSIPNISRISNQRQNSIQQSSFVRRKNYSELIQLTEIPTSRRKKKREVKALSPEQIYRADIIEKALQVSTKGLPSNIRDLISHKQKMVEDKVYLGVSEKGSELLERLYQQIDSKANSHLKERIQQNLLKMMSGIQSRLQEDILDGNKFVIHKIIRSKKQDILSNKKRRSFLEPGETKSLTFNSLNTKENQISKDDDQSYIGSSHPSQEDYTLMSEKTKKAEEFIKKIQQEQQKQRKRRKQQEERRKSLEVRSLEQKKQFEEQIKNERRNYLKRRFEAKKEIKEKELQIRERMDKQYKQFLKKHRSVTPLFKKKEEIHIMFEQQEKKKQQQILQKRQKKPINLKQIMEHDRKYRQIKQEKQNQRAEEKKLQIKQQLSQPKYFKPKIHEILAEEEEQDKERAVKEDPKLNRSQLLKKRYQYSQSVRQNHMPKSDEAKQKQLQELIEKLQWTENLRYGRLQIKERNQLGNVYLKKLHDLISDLKAKDKLPPISKTIDYDQLLASSRPSYKNYLEEIRSIKKKRKYSIDYERDQEKNEGDFDIEQAHFRAKKLEQKAKRREAYVQGGNFNVQRTLDEKKKIQDQYLQSVKAKMALLSKFD